MSSPQLVSARSTGFGHVRSSYRAMDAVPFGFTSFLPSVDDGTQGVPPAAAEGKDTSSEFFDVQEQRDSTLVSFVAGCRKKSTSPLGKQRRRKLSDLLG